MSDKAIIEVNGVKLEVDLRHARRIEEMKVGDRVRVLRREGYAKEIVVSHGTIVGFEPFKELPTIIIAVMKVDWNSAGIEFVYFNSQTEGVEIIKSLDDDELAIDKADFVAKIDREIEKKGQELDELTRKKKFFLDHFRLYWQHEGITA